MSESSLRPEPRRFVPARLVSRFETIGARVDVSLLAVIATLVTLGVLMVFSASYATVGNIFFLAQLKWIGVGALVLVFMSAIPYHFWERMWPAVAAFTILLLVGVLVIGQTSVYGGQRTFTGASLQPSELAKLAMAICAAGWVASRGRDISGFKRGFLPFAIMLESITVLILLEQSVSSSIIVLAIGLTIYFVAGGTVKQVLLLAAIGVAILLAAAWSYGYPFARVSDWYNLWFEPSRASRELLEIASLLRAGNGVGLDPAVWQAKASVFGLWSDFIFANIGSDFGPMGLFGTVALFVAFGYLGLQVAARATDRFGGLLAIGITGWILIQATLHISASVALIPPTGIPLPFLSYGGSSLLSVMTGAGILLSISRPADSRARAFAAAEQARRAEASAQASSTDGTTQAQVSTQELDDILGPLAALSQAPSEAEPKPGALRSPEQATGASPARVPFGDVGRITDPERFFDRDDLLQRIFEELGQGANLSLTGPTQVGKSSILAMLCSLGPERLHLPATAFAHLSLEWIADEDDFYRALSDVLGLRATMRGYALKAVLADRQVVLCLDDADRLGAKGLLRSVSGILRGLADGQGAPLRLVLASRTRLGDPAPGVGEGEASLADICRWLPVEPYSPETARAFLAHRTAGTGVTFSEAEIARMIDSSGGSPGKLQQAAAELYRGRVSRGPGSGWTAA